MEAPRYLRMTGAAMGAAAAVALVGAVSTAPASAQHPTEPVEAVSMPLPLIPDPAPVAAPAAPAPAPAPQPVVTVSTPAPVITPTTTAASPVPVASPAVTPTTTATPAPTPTYAQSGPQPYSPGTTRTVTTCYVSWTTTQVDPVSGQTVPVNGSYGGNCAQAQRFAAQYDATVSQVTNEVTS